ncbi:MAG: formiminoglutamase [Francisella sp.]|jgi:formiminoglutamase
MSNSLYKYGDMCLWQGRSSNNKEYIHQIVQKLDLDNFQINIPPKSYAILGFMSDEGVKRNLGREGAKQGPSSFRQALSGLPIHANFNLYDAGNVECLDGDLESAQNELAKRVRQMLSLGIRPVVIGGGHETAWGHYSGVYQYYNDSVAVLNFDAHFDLRPLVDGKLGSSGTPFFQCNEMLKQNNEKFDYYCAGIQPFSNTKSLFKYADDNGVKYRFAEDINNTPNDTSFIQNIIDNHEKIYVTVCLDVFKSSIAPGVSASQPFGIDTQYVVNSLRLLKQSGKVVSLDIVELAPVFDINNQTAKLASLLLMEYLNYE